MSTSRYSDEDIFKMLKDPLTKEAGFRALIKQYGRGLYWHIRRTVVGHDDAEDAVQETSVKIWTNLDNFQGNASQLKAWIYRIATNEALQLLRKRANFMQSMDSMGEELTQTLLAENPVDGSKAEVLLQEALLKLPTQQRIAFNLRYYDELAYEEIADITGKNVGSLKTSYHIAVEKIKTYLNENV